jgi:hypothetical protein
MTSIQTKENDDNGDDNRSLLSASPTGSSSNNATGNRTTGPKPTITKPKVEWSPENEKILVEWCDVAQCYKWLNTRAHQSYSYRHAWFTIPAIVLSTVSGTASFAQTSIPASYQPYAPMVIGTINILIGILTTIQQYLKISELNEAHRVSAIAWDKFARNIRIELAKAPTERMEAGPFLKLCRQEFDRMMETSPSISSKFTKQFMQKFKGDPKDTEQQARFAALKKPDICNIIVSADETRHHWYKDLEKQAGEIEPLNGHTDFENRVENDILKREETLRAKEQEVHDKEKEVQARAKEIELANLAKEEDEKQQKAREKEQQDAQKATEIAKLQAFVLQFTESRGRAPLKDEIEEYTGDETLGISKTCVQEFLETYEA